MNLHSLVTKVASTVAAATVLGGGTMVLKTATETAVLDTRVTAADARVTAVDASLVRIENKVDKLLEHTAHVDARDGK